MNPQTTAYLGLGANLGDRPGQLKKAIELLHQSEDILVTGVSSVYETAPVGFTRQPDFYNLVVEVKTALSPFALLARVLDIEKKLHRVREIRWGPRTIDIDLLLYDEQIITADKLTIPHPRMTERAFVLIPLREVAGNIRIPGTDKTLEEWISHLPPDQEIKKLSPLSDLFTERQLFI
ncbi:MULTISPECIES: 2-amino-4-hydroxy-6-hydroxymethyldihydropteridine diphosphokinase [Thermoactinomyces]|jgi:2-amino-4-hydroxy-6-hydroxymethyldihydropteridine diphosphokinase|uniref:2-amino-4-hydroxy-6-hydroxymethyldihydropteridine diphosphokinase n=1 Tax=Thermoactinomyces daqus TaxID=1329516 RepID=A0A7W1X9B9_9BACL|nr:MULTISPECIES: 2-amino-4-hydroxy-6-hydroxymethyldihydropteridine diphosphokinase [Thermoactinomyces]MBA4542422.1 2-amino-4-hydroxy-6-hydroxymethyldihydropteridine diphosphokinase [Thermoactinomyces daqus]MBH8598789.1 2-amino-4-hydroxy-6-hydroxymethyldihydropteridine diphosphokinase [Thermoactinomyces sp. CICC 10523]MBH8604774.1 2-amino-4-hydroxy-6-hydroxymethyldihydropteridine diphosphokinase [Thermoactinomyces sp. CICC 10522]MBH8607400.1 2-amino-4-hydroxy-6-hydroxymethyldihydropteridine diph